jgi:RNA polymerase sigma-70 factor, ECF subfamily
MKPFFYPQQVGRLDSMDREKALLANARQLNRDALTEIFELHAPALYKFVYRLYQDAGLADQLVGFIFERFVQELSDSRYPIINLRVYLYEIAYGIIKGDIHFTYPLSPTERIARMNDWWTNELGAEEKRLLSDIHTAMTYSLKADQRNVVILRFIEGFSLKETAKITGKKINNIKVIQNRAIIALHKAVDLPEAENLTMHHLLRRMAST